MLGKRHLILIVLALTVLALTLGVVNAQEKKVLVTALNQVGGDLNTIDPTLAEVAAEIDVINSIFIGLTNVDDITGDVELGLAESMDLSEDGTVYTFKMMQNVPWVRYNAETGAVEEIKDESGNVRYVNAADAVYGMLRGLDPATAAPYSYVPTSYIVGAAEFNGGTGTAEGVMVKALDEYTVQITAPEAVGFTPAIYSLWVVRPVPAWAIEEGGDSWTEPDMIATNGPYALKEWAHEESITMIKNPFWPGTDAIQQAKIDEVVIRFLDPQQQFAEYQAGNIDAAGVPVEEVERVLADPVLSKEYVGGYRDCTYYMGFDNTEYPMTNANLRRALSQAIDRQSIVTNVTKGGQIPAQWFSRPGLGAAPTPEEYPDLGVKFDPVAAKASLEAALKDLGLASVADLPQITLSYNDSAGHAAIMQAIQQMIKDNLGIEAQLAALESSTYFAKVSEDAPMAYRSGWCSDYPDANNFLYDVFYSKSSQNDPGFNNAEYDKLVEQARVETDVAKRTELYAQAEEILVFTDAGIAPIYWYTRSRVIKPYVQWTETLGNEAYYNWDIQK